MVTADATDWSAWASARADQVLAAIREAERDDWNSHLVNVPAIEDAVLRAMANGTGCDEAPRVHGGYAAVLDDDGRVLCAVCGEPKGSIQLAVTAPPMLVVTYACPRCWGWLETEYGPIRKLRQGGSAVPVES